MTGAETFYLWWLIPIIMIVLCHFCSRGCCFGRRGTREDRCLRDQRGPPDSGMRILDRRYAGSEIDDEVERRKNNIFPDKKGAIS